MSHSTSKRPALTGQVLRGGSVAAAVAQVIALASPGQQAQAQEVPVSPLTADELLSQYSPVERDFAIAVAKLENAQQSTFFCPEGCPSPELQNTVFTMFNLVNQAASRLQGGEGPYGIDADSEDGFNNALRWLAPEELFALAPIATGFANGQLGTLDSHMENTRSLSRARLFARNVVSPALKRGYAATSGAGPAGDSFSRLNVFFDVSAAFGDRDDTTDTGSEDAFDFDAMELSLGVDWRFSDHLVAGGLLGYTDRKVDFNVNKSAAGGKIDADGFSLLAFTQWDDLRWYGSLAVGYQKLNYDFNRRIAVIAESDNPGNPFAPDAVALGSSDGSGLLAAFNVGMPFQWGGWGTDVFLKGTWQKQSIDGFSESLTQINSDPSAAGLAFDVGKQDIKSFDTALGFKVQYVATPSFGVVIPFLRGEFHKQLEDSPRAVDLQFQGLDDINPGNFTAEEFATIQDAFQFQLRSERPDKSWFSAAIGASAVIRGSSRVSDSGRGGGGLQCYVQYSTVFGLAHYNNSAISAGLRYEF